MISMLGILLLYVISVGVVLLISLAVIVKLITSPYPIVERYEEETSYVDPETNTRKPFPSINDESSIHLSVVVPAYNEEERLPPMLDEALEFLENRIKSHPSYKYEVIVVSDGSKDQTVKVAQDYAKRYGTDKVRCLELIKNRGKGGAVRLGVESARGATILFADADGASKFENLTKLEASLTDLAHCDIINSPAAVARAEVIVIGSRAHLEKESLATRSVFRNILMFGFHFLVWLLTVRGVRDTQCGFKLLTRRAAAAAFGSLHVDRWAFDVELLYIAQKLNIPISEIPVRWTEIEGSKVTPVLSWVQMGCDLGLIWLKYTIGAWKLKSKQD